MSKEAKSLSRSVTVKPRPLWLQAVRKQREAAHRHAAPLSHKVHKVPILIKREKVLFLMAGYRSTFPVSVYRATLHMSIGDTTLINTLVNNYWQLILHF